MFLRSSVLLLALISSSVHAVTLPNNFGPGTRVTNAKLQANFQALANAITALESGTGALTTAGVAGTYKVESIETFLGGVPGNSSGDNYQHRESRYTGTAVFNANGTYTLSLTSDSLNSEVEATLRNVGDHNHNVPSIGASTSNSGSFPISEPGIGLNRSTGGESDNGTWTIAGNQVVITDEESNVKTLDLIGGKLMIYTETEDTDVGGSFGGFFFVTILIKQPAP